MIIKVPDTLKDLPFYGKMEKKLKQQQIWKNEKWEIRKYEKWEIWKNTAGKSAKAAANCLNNDRYPMHTVREADPDAISTIFL